MARKLKSYYVTVESRFKVQAEDTDLARAAAIVMASAAPSFIEVDSAGYCRITKKAAAMLADTDLVCITEEDEP